MKKLISTLIAMMFLLQACSTGAPYQRDKAMTFEQNFGGARMFIQDNHAVDESQAMRALEGDPKTNSVMQTANGLDIGSLVFAGAGGYMLGYGLASLTSNYESDRKPILIYTGAASIVLSVLFNKWSGKEISKAVDLRNENLKSTSAFSFAPTGFAFQF
jgi:hypothetical protein